MHTLMPRLEFLFQSMIKEQKTCPHCKSLQCTTIARKYRPIKIKKCSGCHLHFTSPVYKTYFSDNFYDRFYHAQGSTTRLPSDEELKEMKSNLFEGSDKYFGDRIEAIKTVCKKHNLLEIGPSWGYFLYQLQNRGFKATGVEIADTRRQFGIDNLDLSMVASFAELGQETFDVIYTSHVLEHFTDLSDIFLQINTHSKIGTILIIEVPNFDYEQFGHTVLKTIGAIHPVGFHSEFFKRNLPDYGFEILGFYDSWDNFPSEKVGKSSKDSIILLAECRNKL